MICDSDIQIKDNLVVGKLSKKVKLKLKVTNVKKIKIVGSTQAIMSFNFQAIFVLSFFEFVNAQIMSIFFSFLINYPTWLNLSLSIT